MTPKHDIIASYLKEHLETVRGLHKRYTEKARLLKLLLPEGTPTPIHISNNIVDDLWLVYPYDKVLIMTVLEIFQSAGYEVVVARTEAEASEYKNPLYRTRVGNHPEEVLVMIEFDPTRPGSTCVRKQIGTKVVEEPIFEFVCPEANNEHVQV
jgi:hypothetical protein